MRAPRMGVFWEEENRRVGPGGAFKEESEMGLCGNNQSYFSPHCPFRNHPPHFFTLNTKNTPLSLCPPPSLSTVHQPNLTVLLPPRGGFLAIDFSAP